MDMRKILACCVLSLLALGALSSLAGCGGQEGGNGGQLEGKAWRATAFSDGMGGTLSPVAGSELTALFEEGTVSGFSGVNNFSGGYTVDGSSISIGPLATTLMAGDPELMDQEASYVAALQSAATFSVTGSKLELRSANGALAVSCETGE
jgi:heat shock protein HslJ